MSMFHSLADRQTNPWSDDEASLGSISYALALAENTGQLKRGTLYDQSDALEAARETSVSLKMIKILQDIQQMRKQIDQVNLEIHSRLQDKETKDLTHKSAVEKRIQPITVLNSHLQQIINEKTQLIDKLQRSYVGDFLKMDASYHEYASKLFPQVASVLSDLTSQLENIMWASSSDLQDGEMEDVLKTLSSTLALVQSKFHSLSRLRQAVHQLRQS